MPLTQIRCELSQGNVPQHRAPLLQQEKSFRPAADPWSQQGQGRRKDAENVSNAELLKKLGQGKDKSAGMAMSIRESLQEMSRMMDAHDLEKEPVSDLRDGMPVHLEKLNDAWLQTDDLGAVRDAMDEDADRQKVARYEDEYSVMSRCRFKYNPVQQLQRYIPAVGLRELLSNRGVAVEILGDPMKPSEVKGWQRRARIISNQAACGPMDRPKGHHFALPATFGHKSSFVTSIFRRRTVGVRDLLFTSKTVVLGRSLDSRRAMTMRAPGSKFFLRCALLIDL
jgi:hypothetical protein